MPNNKWKQHTLIGCKSGKLTVISLVEKTAPSREGRVWLCQCECGNTRTATTYEINKGRAKSCGCSPPEHLERSFINKKFGNLTVLEKLDEKTKDGRVLWRCKCVCGKTDYIVHTSMLSRGQSRSCGCKQHPKGLGKLPDGEGCRNRVITSYKSMAKKANREYSLSIEDAEKLFKNSCYYCGSQPSNIKKSKHHSGDYIYSGIDRLDNSKGYTVNNTVSCCKFCNFKKGSTDYPEFIRWIQKVYQNIP